MRGCVVRHGPGYYTALAKHQGLAFANSVIVTTVHCPALFYLDGSSNYLTSFNYLASDFLERAVWSLLFVLIPYHDTASGVV